jgi:anti-anti-sigma factor
MSSSLDGSHDQVALDVVDDLLEDPVFSCSLQRRGETVVLALRGELDIAVADPLERAAVDSIMAGCRHLVIDLRALHFLDACGLRALLRIRAHSGQTVHFELDRGPPAITRVFELIGLTSSLPFRDSAP